MIQTDGCYLVDASVYIFRAYFSLPDQWHTAEGDSTFAVYGYCRFLLNLLHTLGDEPPAGIGVCFDESLGTCFRNDIYPDYKASRVLPDENLAFQLECCKTVTQLMGIATYASQRFEADDLIATLCRKWRASSASPAVIVTADKDLGQLLLRPQDQWWNPDFGRQRPGTSRDRDGVFQQFGVWPEQFSDYLALVGDPVDDIPGVPGIGPKKAAALLQQWPTLEQIFTSLSAIETSEIRGARSLVKVLQQHQAQARMARELARCSDVVPELLSSMSELEVRPASRSELVEFVSLLGLGVGLQKDIQRLSWLSN